MVPEFWIQTQQECKNEFESECQRIFSQSADSKRVCALNKFVVQYCRASCAICKNEMIESGILKKKKKKEKKKKKKMETETETENGNRKETYCYSVTI